MNIYANINGDWWTDNTVWKISEENLKAGMKSEGWKDIDEWMFQDKLGQIIQAYGKELNISILDDTVRSDEGKEMNILEKARKNYAIALEDEERTQGAAESMERKYWEGYLDALELILEGKA